MIDPSPSEMDGTPPPRFSFSVRGLLFFTAATSAVLAIAVALGSPDVASGAAVLCLYGFAVRYQFGDQGPLVIWTIGALMLVASLAISRANPDSFFTYIPLAFFGTVVLGIAAFSYLLMAAVAKKDRLRWQNASCVFLSGATWLLWLLVGVGSIGAEREAEQVRRAAEDPIKLQKLIDDTNAVVQRLGRTPEDQAELVAELGYPLPKVLDGSTESPVSYQRYTDSRFILHYELWATDDWTYDSSKPAAGWVQSYY